MLISPVTAQELLRRPAAPPVVSAPAPLLRYADIADLTLAAPVIVRATITRTQQISAAQSPGLAGGRARLLVTATVAAALVAPGTVPATLTWLWDAPLDARGKAPKPKGISVLAWLDAPSADGKTRLISMLAQQDWTAPLEARTRAIATEARTGQVPVITGVSNGFRADGTVPGESESQFFLTTADARPLTLVVTARPGQPRRVAVASGDVIDESASPVQPETLLWYRIACGLPVVLPEAAGGENVALAADWRAARTAIGACARTSG